MIKKVVIIEKEKRNKTKTDKVNAQKRRKIKINKKKERNTKNLVNKSARRRNHRVHSLNTG